MVEERAAALKGGGVDLWMDEEIIFGGNKGNTYNYEKPVSLSKNY